MKKYYTFILMLAVVLPPAKKQRAAKHRGQNCERGVGCWYLDMVGEHTYAQTTNVLNSS